MAKLKAIFKRADRADAYSGYVSDTLENLQRWVDGYIETVQLYREEKGHPGVVLICNEEGIIKGLPYNCHMAGIPIFGNFLVLGTKGEEFCDVPVTPRFVNSYIFNINAKEAHDNAQLDQDRQDRQR